VRILVAPDKFKGSLSARAVAENIGIGLRSVLPDAIIERIPVADGGEGTAEVIREASGGEWVACPAHDALGRPIDSRYAWLRDRATAVIDVSEAAGLWRITADERDLLRANSFGVGEMMKDAATRGAKDILIGLGGSATNDSGFGMARALGFSFLEHDEEHELETPADLLELTRIVRPGPGALDRIRIIALADVRSALLGERGATHTFGRQKGGGAEQLELLERALTRLADIATRDLNCDFRDVPGAGAAGGLGFGLMTFCGAVVRPGFDVVAEFTGLRTAIEKADVVITGEGRLDEQTLEGKAPAGVARLACEMNKRVVAITGSCSESPEVRNLFDAVAVLARNGITSQDAIGRAPELLQERARELAQMM
jgi:glycerate kinase